MNMIHKLLIHNINKYQANPLIKHFAPDIHNPFIKNLSNNDEFIKSVSEFSTQTKLENENIFLEHIPQTNKPILQKFLELPGYNKDILLPFFTDKKQSELEYLYEIAKLKDSKNELRIPGITFPYFSEFPEGKLKALTPIMLSKNDFGQWNYIPTFILDLGNYSEKQIANMAKLSQYKVNGYCMKLIAQTPPEILNIDKIIEKAEILNKLYNENLREISIFCDKNRQFYLKARIQNSHNDNIPDVENYKEVISKIDNHLNPVEKDYTTGNIDNSVNQIYDNIHKNLYLMTENNLNQIIDKISKKVPAASEQEILTVMQKITQFADYSSLKEIENKLKNLNIGKIANAGELYKYFDYFVNSKHILNLPLKANSDYAFFLTNNYLNNQQEVKTLRHILQKGITPNIKFINLEGWSDGINLFSDNSQLEEKTLRILTKARKLAVKNPALTFEEAVSKTLNNKITNIFNGFGVKIYTITNDKPATKANILSQINPFEPSKEILKSTIEAITKHYVPNEFFTKGLSERLAEYYKNSINVYSRQGIIENLKIIKSKIDDFLIHNNLSNDNLYFIVPKLESVKSYDIIMKMYQDLYNIPQEKIISLKYINQLNSYNKNATFVLLDDMVGSGNSMTNAGGYSIYGETLSKDKHILFAPITGCIDGINFIKAVIHRVKRNNTDAVISIEANLKESQSLKNVFQSLYFKIDNPTKYAYGCEGYDMGGLCTIFPYMTPDNNSSLASDIAKFFVPNYKCIRNLNIDMKKIEEKSYYYNIFGKEKDNITIIQNK